MALFEGQQVELTIEKPASGGRMIARHLGQVVLVRGAIPGERVRAWIERAEKRMAYAVTREVVEPSPDRRPTAGDDPLCGGALYSHIAYARQLAIKSDVIRDAFARLGRYPIERPIDVAGSPEDGLPDARALPRPRRARRLLPRRHAPAVRRRADAAAARRDASLRSRGSRPRSTATRRGAVVVDHDHREHRRRRARRAPRARAAARVSATRRSSAPPRRRRLAGVSAQRLTTRAAASTTGHPVVTDPLSAITGGRVAEGTLRRHAESFFQGNRYLLAGCS